MTRTNTVNASTPEPQEPDFFSQFEQLFAETQAKAAAAKPAPVKGDSSGRRIPAAFMALEEATQGALTRAGMTHGSEILLQFEGEEAKGKTPQNLPSRLSATSGKNADAWSTKRNKARQMFLLTVIALAAQNKGRIAIVDAACLAISFNLPEFNTGNAGDYVSVQRVALELHKRLHRTVEVKGEHITVEGLQLAYEIATYPKVANAAISHVKTLLKSEAKQVA
jgi:hypothetical protein